MKIFISVPYYLGNNVLACSNILHFSSSTKILMDCVGLIIFHTAIFSICLDVM